MPRKKTERLVLFHRDNILKAAEELFSKKGILETTMDDIAKEADYSKSTIYVYFKSKDEIYQYIVYEHMCHLRDVFMSTVQETTNFEQCYVQICNTLVTVYEQHPLYFESVMGNIDIDKKDREEKEILQRIYETGEDINTCLSMVFEKGIQEQYLRQDIPILPTIFTLWASLTNIILMANNKRMYIAERMNLEKADFMQYGFSLLLTSIKK